MNENHQANDAAVKELCLACGFCCDGTLFCHVPIADADNLPALEAAAIKVLVHGNERRFEQPCSAYARQSCQIYADRPAACRKFSCKLRQEYRKQEISANEAQQKIQRVIFLRKNLLDSLQRIDPSLPGMALPELWRNWDKSASGNEGIAFRRKHGAALMQMAALMWYLEQHFFAELQPKPP